MIISNRYKGHLKPAHILAVLLLSFCLSRQAVSGNAYTSLSTLSRADVLAPPVTIESGTAGASTLYTNKTSARVRAVATAPTPIYYPSAYTTVDGYYISGSVPQSVQTVDADYFSTRSAATTNTTYAYNPSNYALLGNTTLVSGTSTDLASNNGLYMTFRSYDSATSAQVLYAHQETTLVGGTSYYLLKSISADAGGTTSSADAGTLGRKLMAKHLYQLSGITIIPGSTWTMYYRTYKGHVQVGAHCDIDVLVRMSNDTVRTTLATNVADTGNLPTSWQTLSSTYPFSSYTVADQTDYLEIDFYIEVTNAKAGYFAYLRIDDNTIATADQTRCTNIMLPSQYMCEAEFTGTSNTETWNQLVWTVDTAWTTGSITVTVQVYNYTSGTYASSGDGYDSYNSNATPNTDETRTKTTITNATNFRDGTGNWKIKIIGIKTTTTAYDLKIDWLEYKTTHPSGYVVSMEFTFTSMTTNIPVQLNFTVVSQYTDTNVNVTIQTWNYSSSSYVTSGEGYLNYTATASNETASIDITGNPEFYTQNGNARVKITGATDTSVQFQQEINQLQLIYNYLSNSTYDYVLKIVNQQSDPWRIRLKAYDQTNIARLNNCTIYFHNSSDGMQTQIVVANGAYEQQTGLWYDLPPSPSEIYIAVTLDASNSQTSVLQTQLEILVPDKTTYAKYTVTFEIT